MIFKSLQGSSGACWARVVHSQVPVAGGAQRSTPPLQALLLPLDESCSGCRPLALMVSPGFSGVPLGPGPQSVTRGWCCLISVPRVGGQQAEMPRQFPWCCLSYLAFLLHSSAHLAFQAVCLCLLNFHHCQKAL